MPRNSVPNMAPMTTSVVAAFFGSGGWKLGTPLATASLPVRPTDPDANARSTRKAVRTWTPEASNGSGGTAATIGSPIAIRMTPTAMRAYSERT